MWRKPFKHFGAILIVIALTGLMFYGIAAQEVTEVPQQTPTDETEQPPVFQDAITVTRSEPGQVDAGSGGTVSIFGTNFADDVIVRLVGYGLLPVTVVNSTALTVNVPGGIPQGTYTLEVSAPGRGTATSPNSLVVFSPPVPLPTQPAPTAVPTAQPTDAPTPVPGQPALVVRNFTANPASTIPGGGVRLTFEVVNQGNRAALGVSVSVAPDGGFVPASGQASAVLPDIPPGGGTTVTLDVFAAQDAPVGPNSVPITMAYRDYLGETYTATAELTVGINAANDTTQVTVSRFEFEPDPVVPGDPVTVRVYVTNSGTMPAHAALLRIGGENSVLLAGRQGDTFPLGDIPPNGTVTLELPLIVASDAEAGARPQPITLTYRDSMGEQVEANSSLTVEIAHVNTPLPLILLESYDFGAEVLKPGDRFTLDLSLRNVGGASADGLLVTFGTVESTGGGSGSGSGGGTGGQTTGGGSTTTNPIPGNAFAPLGAGDTRYLGALDPDATSALTQEFIVNSTVASGIYSLPITVRYQLPDGEEGQQTLNASVIVVAPPRLRVNLSSPIPEGIPAGEVFPLPLEIANQGTIAVNLSEAVVAGENVEIVEGAETALDPLAADDDTLVNAMVMPMEEGEFSVTLALHYIDDLNRPQTYEVTYTGIASAPPPPMEAFPPPMEVMPTPEAPEEDNLLGRLLLGFLGLGG